MKCPRCQQEARPGAKYQHAWGGRTYYRQLRIDPLGGESADELLRALLGADPSLDTVKRLLLERTQGNPFFLEESVRGLLEVGALGGERGGHRLSHPVAALQVPASVQALLASRIDRLAAEDKQLLETASAIGKDVPYPLLAAVAGEDEGVLQQRLGRLQGAEFLYETRLLSAARRSFEQALALAEELGMRSLVGHCHLGLGKLYRRTEKSEQAQEHLATATTMYREMG